MAAKIFEAGSQWKNVLHFISPNRNELKVISKYFNIPVTENMDLTAVKNITEQLLEYIPIVITTLGSQGVLVCLILKNLVFELTTFLDYL